MSYIEGYLDKQLNKLRAWRKGKNPKLTIPNPAASATAPMTNKLFVRKDSNAVWGDPRKQVMRPSRHADSGAD